MTGLVPGTALNYQSLYLEVPHGQTSTDEPACEPAIVSEGRPREVEELRGSAHARRVAPVTESPLRTTPRWVPIVLEVLRVTSAIIAGWFGGNAT